jgi:hypothetical protein
MMGRKIALFFLLFGVGLVFAALGIGAKVVPMAAAQNICPPGQTFVIAQEFDAQTNRCVTAQVRCPQGQAFDAQTNRCVTAQVRCPQGQAFDAQTNRCVTAGLVPSLPGLPSPQR